MRNGILFILLFFPLIFWGQDSRSELEEIGEFRKQADGLKENSAPLDSAYFVVESVSYEAFFYPKHTKITGTIPLDDSTYSFTVFQFQLESEVTYDFVEYPCLNYKGRLFKREVFSRNDEVIFEGNVLPVIHGIPMAVEPDDLVEFYGLPLWMEYPELALLLEKTTPE